MPTSRGQEGARQRRQGQCSRCRGVGRTGQGWLQMRPGCRHGVPAMAEKCGVPLATPCLGLPGGQGGPGKRAPGAAGQPRVGATGQAGACSPQGQRGR